MAVRPASNTALPAALGAVTVGLNVTDDPAARSTLQRTTGLSRALSRVPPAKALAVKPAGNVNVTIVPLAAALPVFCADRLAVNPVSVSADVGAVSESTNSSRTPITVLASVLSLVPLPVTVAVCSNVVSAVPAAAIVMTRESDASGAKLSRLQV